ncbi:hypothetical protein [Rhizobium binxianense]|uniref:hypothetical protein n=1 Tax=Rhizobium binxianense TaxID=3024242 RepID=UPI00234EA746|nr:MULTISPECIES: hypothetical protein [unclassified Rhizobium]MDC7743501.1 hypothetical protein [Rhizobium sp. BC56]MDC9832670.1 hypothetical protein [Rhizobium sp. MJ37]
MMMVLGWALAGALAWDGVGFPPWTWRRMAFGGNSLVAAQSLGAAGRKEEFALGIHMIAARGFTN